MLKISNVKSSVLSKREYFDRYVKLFREGGFAWNVETTIS